MSAPWEDETVAEAAERQDAEYPVCDECGGRLGMDCRCCEGCGAAPGQQCTCEALPYDLLGWGGR